MHVLSVYFSLIFLFVNPTMYFIVTGELVKHLQRDENVAPEQNRQIFRALHFHTAWLLAFLHCVLSIMQIYGWFTLRLSYVLPMLVYCLISAGLMLIYLIVTTLTIINASYSSVHMIYETEKISQNFTIGFIFFLLYLLWIITILHVYKDIKSNYADLMIWKEYGDIQYSPTLQNSRWREDEMQWLDLDSTSSSSSSFLL